MTLVVVVYKLRYGGPELPCAGVATLYVCGSTAHRSGRCSQVLTGRAGFNTDTAVALSNITIVGGAISNFLFNVGRRHEYFDKPLIDWDLILVMEPTTILGALVGGYLNKV